MRLFQFTVCSLAIGFIAGCASPPKAETFRNQSEIIVTDARNAPLACMVLGLSAFRSGVDAEAESLFDRALGVSGAVQRNFNARLARSYFWSEDTKTFIGEAHEHALCFFYRGILFWKKQDYQNARACFRSAALVSSTRAGSSFSLFDYLDGFSSFLLDSDFGDALRRSRSFAVRLKPSDYEHANLFLFFEVGEGPQKVSGGQYGEALSYQRPQCDVSSLRVTVGESSKTIALWEDTVFAGESSSRPEMDRVLSNKAHFKSAANRLLIGADRRGSPDLAGTSLFCAAIDPRADRRSWFNLPQFLAFSAETLNPGSYKLKVEYLDAYGRTIDRLSREQTIQIEEKHPLTLMLNCDGHAVTDNRKMTSLEDLSRLVPDAKSFPTVVQTFEAGKNDLWESACSALIDREQGLIAEGNSGIIFSFVRRHGIAGFPLYRQYLAQVSSIDSGRSELRFVQLLYYPTYPDDPFTPGSQRNLPAVTAADQPGLRLPPEMQRLEEFKRELHPEIHDREKRAFLRAVAQKLSERRRSL